MVRNYQRKKPPPPYTKEQLQHAVEMVKSGETTMYRASTVFSIPYPSLFKHVKGQRGVKSQTSGRPTALNPDDERKIAQCIKTMERSGFGLSKKEVLELIGRYVRENKIDTPFKDGIPGDDFFLRFKTEHNLSIKKPQHVEVARKRGIDPFITSKYFELLEEVIEGVRPTQIYNIDESCFCTDPRKAKVVGEKGAAAHRVTSGPGRENISVLIGANAAGEKLPPLIIFKGKFVWNSWIPTKGEFPQSSYAATKNGWMDAPTFENFFINSFIKKLPSERPVVVILDGHSSHVSIMLIEKAREENVTILKLPPHTTHLLQPMDCSVFKPMKDKWEELIIKWQRQHYGCKLPKSVFVSILSKVWMELDPDTIRSGFQKCGISPFNKDVIPTATFDPNQYRRWCETQRASDHSGSTGDMPEVPSSANDDETSTRDTAALSSRPCEFPEVFPSTPSSSRVITPLSEAPQPSASSQTKRISFEELLLQQVKQSPIVTTRRKRVCPGAEVITSDEVLARLKNQEISKKSGRATKKKGSAKKRKTKNTTVNESSDGDEPNSFLDSDSDEEYDVEEELQEEEEENNFTNIISKTISQAAVGDWVLVKLTGDKSAKMFIGQLTDVETCLEAKFARRVLPAATGKSLFRWPDIEDKSIIRGDEIVNFLPAPTFEKRGKFKFDFSFEYSNIG